MSLTLRAANIRRKDINRQLRGILLKHLTSKVGLKHERLYMRRAMREVLTTRLNELTPDTLDLISQSGCSELISMVLGKLTPEQKYTAALTDFSLARNIFPTLNFTQQLELIRTNNDTISSNAVSRYSPVQVAQVLDCLENERAKKEVWRSTSQETAETLIKTGRYTTFLIQQNLISNTSDHFPKMSVDYLNALSTVKVEDGTDINDNVKDWLREKINTDITIKIKKETTHNKILALDLINNLELSECKFDRVYTTMEELAQNTITVSLGKPQRRNVSLLLLDQILKANEPDNQYHSKILSQLLYKDPTVRTYLGKILYTKGGENNNVKENNG